MDETSRSLQLFDVAFVEYWREIVEETHIASFLTYLILENKRQPFNRVEFVQVVESGINSILKEYSLNSWQDSVLLVSCLNCIVGTHTFPKSEDLISSILTAVQNVLKTRKFPLNLDVKHEVCDSLRIETYE